MLGRARRSPAELESVCLENFVRMRFSELEQQQLGVSASSGISNPFSQWNRGIKISDTLFTSGWIK